MFLQHILKRNSRYIWRYLNVALILAAIFLYGKSYPDPSKYYEFDRAAATRLADQRDNSTLKPGDQSLAIGDIFDTKPGEVYHVVYQLSNLAPAYDVAIDNIILDIYAVGDGSTTKHLDQVTLKTTDTTIYKETYLFSDSVYRGLSVQKINQKYPLGISFKVISASKVNINGSRNLSSLTPTVIGQTLIKPMAINNSTATKSFLFLRNNYTVGQIITPEADLLNGMDIKLDFIGTGGSGDYLLELTQIEQSQNDIRLAVQPIVSISFNARTVNQFYIADDVARFPLIAKLDTTKKYLLSVCNRQVDFNYQNTLQIKGYKSNEILMRGINNHLAVASGSVIWHLFYAQAATSGENKLASRSLIEDLGDGQYKYSYKQDGSQLDLLDVFELDNFGDVSALSFSPSEQAVVFARDRENAIGYDFYTKYAWKEAKISYRDLGSDYAKPVLFYSADHINWQEISWLPNGSRHSAVISGSANSDHLYLKITYDKQVATVADLVGYNDLNIEASLEKK